MSLSYPRKQWPNTPVHVIMTPIKQLHIVKPSNSILEVLQIMHQHGVNQAPVVDEKTIVGWIDRENLLRILQLHIAIGR
jgi:predicted transcriptional regulator